MVRTARAAVFRAAGVRAAVETVEIAAPAPGEVTIRVAAAGVCHTDVTMAAGVLWPVYPVALGHEIAGTIVETGAGVSSHAPGDRVLVLDGHCGSCADCESGHPVQCRTFDLAERRRHIVDAGRQPVLQSMGGFAEFVTCPAHSVFAIPPDVSFEVAAVVSCAGVTGYGAVANSAAVRTGEWVAIVGCGGVGLAALMTARAAGASVVVVDPDPDRRATALELGAVAAAVPELSAIRELRPEGFAAAIECAGRPEAIRLATQILARGGRAVVTGAPGPDVRVEVDVLDLVLEQRTIIGCLRGDIRPAIDLPAIFGLHRSGLFPIDRAIGRRVRLDDLPEAIVESGGLRTVVLPEG